MGLFDFFNKVDKSEESSSYKIESELGYIGLKEHSGIVLEDFVPKLKSISSRMKTYSKMVEDHTVGAILFAIEMHIRRVEWHIKAASETAKDKKYAEFVEDNRANMSHTFQDFLTEVLSMLPYGFSIHEIVYKLDDKGYYRWKKLPIRAQSTVHSWSFDEEGGLNGFWQTKKNCGGYTFIPIEKMLLFRPSTYKNNPEGKSVLRTAYRPWYFRTKLEVVEAIGIERDLNGYPVIYLPTQYWQNNKKAAAMRKRANDIVTRVRKDEQMGAVMPADWKFDLLSSSGGGKQLSPEVISRYDVRIAQSLLSDIIMLGHERAGSYALSEQKYDLFVLALDAWLDTITEVFNKFAIPRLFKLNGFDSKNGFPELTHEPVTSIDPQKLANVLFRLSGINLIQPDDKLEEYLRDFLGLPEADKDTTRVADVKLAHNLKDLDSIDRMVGGRLDNETRPADSSGDYNQSQ